MEYSVKLEKLSESVVFPDRLRQRVNHDASRGRLSYQGFMTKCAYDELAKLTEDPDYRRALEQLFVKTSAEVAPQSAAGGYAKVIALATAAVVLIAALVSWTLLRQSRAGSSPAESAGSAHVAASQ